MSVKQPGTPIWVEYAALIPAPYNPNVMSEADLARERESITKLGFILPIVTRNGPRPGSYWIVDGEHRRDIGHELGIAVFPCWNLGDVDEVAAREMTLVLNSLHGTPDHERLRVLLDELAASENWKDLEALVPFDEGMFRALIDEIPAPPPAPEFAFPVPNAVPALERWVERVFRLPVGAAEVVDEAFAKVRKDDPDLAEWQCLEAVCADFMGS